MILGNYFKLLAVFVGLIAVTHGDSGVSLPNLSALLIPKCENGEVVCTAGAGYCFNQGSTPTAQCSKNGVISCSGGGTPSCSG
ncbi:uncharacterized protein MELLADRAFT_124486 [Melampsora larici-populina 98AG31]|uniref:Secreted protein n=1 Tax=Melampsora larici-populina (strain 98AG31 / pathotype 3-4-7) TaxID=747676 RepID=F4RQA3_MELLP|nr:uncharacterized protein MELLADRAFT_124486 [Melampsora larici-populina 98AG31]EGG05440.1 secreted protein [Melampsora larici-populina 98AG31]